MDYSEAMAFLEDTKKYGSILGLDSIRRLMNELGNVQDELKIVHITGTNGKGSTGAMLAAICKEAGLKTGRFNTPDVFCYEDEFLINGEHIAKDALALIYTDVKAACEHIVGNGFPHPTRFEIETAAAFVWFYREQVDIALIEVGMGGETDATNLIKKPVLSLITSISLDHMGFLGDTIAEIAGVKSGIIKKNCPVISVVQPEDAMAVIRDKADAMESELYISDAGRACDVAFGLDGVSFKLDDISYRCSLIGDYQLENAVCAVDAAKILKNEFASIDESSIISGLSKVTWPGRFEIIDRNPLFIIDGAHNHGAAIKLRKTIDTLFADKKIYYVMGILADKEYEKVIAEIFKEGDTVFTVTPPNPRAFKAEELASVLNNHNINATSCENCRNAVSLVKQIATKDDVIIAFGSLYALKEIKEAAR